MLEYRAKAVKNKMYIHVFSHSGEPDLRLNVYNTSVIKDADSQFKDQIQGEALLISTSQQRALGKLANIISSSFINSVCFLHAAQLKRSEGDRTFGYILSKTQRQGRELD